MKGGKEKMGMCDECGDQKATLICPNCGRSFCEECAGVWDGTCIYCAPTLEAQEGEEVEE